MTADSDWTPNMDATLSSMKAMGCTFRQIGRAVGRSRHAAQKRWYSLRDGKEARQAHRLMLLPPPPPEPCPNDDEKHIRLIAKAHGCGFPYLNVPAAYRVSA